MKSLPRFVHKHVVVYKMYRTLHMYYLHEQELMNQVLGVLSTHKSSEALAAKMKGYFGQMHSGNYGWVS